MAWVVVVAALTAAVAGWLALRIRRRRREVAEVIGGLHDNTVIDRHGAVRSTQAADLVMSREALDAIWSPMHLERLARTYWRFLTRATLGVVRVVYTDTGRCIVLLTRPLVLLSFRAPEYEMSGTRGVVTWRIERGVLVARKGRNRDGYLRIDVERRPADDPAHGIAHVEVEVANFYPSIASGIATWVYRSTQARIHVIVTRAFIRSLARLDLDRSRVRRFEIAEVPDPQPRDLSRP